MGERFPISIVPANNFPSSLVKLGTYRLYLSRVITKLSCPNIRDTQLGFSPMLVKIILLDENHGYVSHRKIVGELPQFVAPYLRGVD